MKVVLDGTVLSLRFMHERFKEPMPYPPGIETVGAAIKMWSIGRTRASLVDKDRLEVAAGESYCSWLDNFDKEKGRKYAIENMIQREAKKWPKMRRFELWRQYFTRDRHGVPAKEAHGEARA